MAGKQSAFPTASQLAHSLDTDEMYDFAFFFLLSSNFNLQNG